jgi:hypothetical protein
MSGKDDEKIIKPTSWQLVGVGGPQLRFGSRNATRIEDTEPLPIVPSTPGDRVLSLAMQQRGAGVFNGVKVFSATKIVQRAQLGDVITEWLASSRSRDVVITDVVVTQSSDDQFHCLAITIFYWEHTHS